MFNFSTDSSLIYDKEKIENNSEPSIPGLVERQLNAGFAQIGISDWAAENSNYTDLVDRLKLAGKTDKQLFEQFQDANLDFRLKSKLAIRSVDGPESVFNLKQDRVIKLMNWYIPPNIDKSQILFDDLSRLRLLEQIASEVKVSVGIIRKLRSDFSRLWRFADSKKRLSGANRRLKGCHLEFIGEFIKENSYKHWTEWIGGRSILLFEMWIGVLLFYFDFWC